MLWEEGQSGCVLGEGGGKDGLVRYQLLLHILVLLFCSGHGFLEEVLVRALRLRDDSFAPGGDGGGVDRDGGGSSGHNGCINLDQSGRNSVVGGMVLTRTRQGNRVEGGPSEGMERESGN